MNFIITILNIFLLLLFLPFWSVAQSSLPLRFEERDFERNVNRWHQLENEQGEVWYTNVLYVNPEEDFLLEATFNWGDASEKAQFGFSWGRRNRYDYRHFELNKHKQFRLGYQRGTQYNVVQPWTARRGCINWDENTVGIQKKGQELRFIINGKMIYKTTYRRFEHCGIALQSNTPALHFLRFAIYQKQAPVHLPPNVDTALLGRPQNLGTLINSELVEKAPIISPDGQFLYWVREQAKDGYGQQDIYYSQQLGDGQWGAVQNIGHTLNNSKNNFVVSAFPDNNRLVTINAYNKAHKNEILSLMQRTKKGWELVKTIEIEELKNIGRWVSFDLSADGRTLVFAMHRPDSYGGRDLYVSFLQNNGIFSRPRNLGSTINTTGNEHSPFLAADGKTLYFDTDGHAGYGGRDIFKTTRLDASWRQWEIPQNLGSTINTKGADEGLRLSASGKQAYFVSTRAGQGAYDLYTLELPSVFRPAPVALVTGFVVDCTTMQGITTTIKVYKDAQLLPITTARTHPVTGQFKVVLPQGGHYKLITTYKKETYQAERDTITIDLKNLNQYIEQELPPICLHKKNSKPVIPIRAEHPYYSPCLDVATYVWSKARE